MARHTYGFDKAEEFLGRKMPELTKVNMLRATQKNAQSLRDQIKRTIRDGRPEWDPLKPATIARKGSSKPLIDYGDLLGCIDYAKASEMSFFVGVPRNAKHRKGEELVNIGLVHEFGCPEKKIPPRPYLTPTIAEQREAMTDRWRQALKCSVEGRRYAGRD